MDFDSTPAEQAPSPQSVPFTPAAVWRAKNRHSKRRQRLRFKQNPCLLLADSTARSTAGGNSYACSGCSDAADPTGSSLNRAAGCTANTADCAATAYGAAATGSTTTCNATGSARSRPVQETMLDKFDMVMQNLEVQGEKRMLDALAAKPAIFAYAKVKENIEDRDSTFEDLRQGMRRISQSFRTRRPYPGR